MFRKGDEPIPGYRLEKFLGKGQFGEVWRTSAPGGTSAALKFIDLGGKQGLKEFRGVRRVKEIRHANLMPITALWMLDGEGNVLGDKTLESYDPDSRRVQATLDAASTDVVRPEWLVVAMLLGKQNLSDRLQDCLNSGQLGIPAPELLRYMEEAAKGIDYLNSAQHELGDGPVALQHCDIKPANVMLIGDAAVVCDFGLARVLTDSAATATGMVGSPAYMAPECIARKPGSASDQYSLAISYVELRTGQLPFQEITYIAVLEANRTGSLDLSRLPPAEQKVIRKATSVRPEDRYASSTEMVAALRRAVEGKDQPESLPIWTWMVAAALILMTVPATVWLGVQYWKRPAAENLEITLSPADSQVTINGKAATVSPTGLVSLPLLPGERVEFMASHGDDYLPLRREFHAGQLPEGNRLALTLERSAAWYAKEAWAGLSSGDFAAAVRSYTRAVQLDRAWLQPAPIELKHHQKEARFVKSSPRGDFFLSAGDDGTAALWSLTDEGPRTSPVVLSREAKETIEAVAVAPSGNWAATGTWDDRVVVWDLKNPQSTPPLELTGHSEDVVDVQVSGDGKWLLSAGLQKSLWIWRIQEERPVTPGLELQGHEVELRRIQASPDGKWFVSLDVDNHLRRWDLRAEKPEGSGMELPTPPHSARVLLITPNNVLVSGGDDGRLAAISLDQPNEWRAPGATADSIESLALSPDGGLIAAGHSDGRVGTWTLAASEPATPRELDLLTGPVHSLAWTPNVSPGSSAGAASERLLIAGCGDGSIALWSVDSQPAVSLRIPGKHGQVYQVAVTPDGKWLAASCGDGVVLAWKLDQLRVIAHSAQGVGNKPVELN